LAAENNGLLYKAFCGQRKYSFLLSEQSTADILLIAAPQCHCPIERVRKALLSLPQAGLKLTNKTRLLLSKVYVGAELLAETLSGAEHSQGNGFVQKS